MNATRAAKKAKSGKKGKNFFFALFALFAFFAAPSHSSVERFIETPDFPSKSSKIGR